MTMHQVKILSLTLLVASACGAAPSNPDVGPNPQALTSGPARSAFDFIEAETAEVVSGVVIWPLGLSYVEKGDYVAYKNVDFGSGVTARHFSTLMAMPNSNNVVELRLDNPEGRLLGTLKTRATGSAYVTYEKRIGSLDAIADVKGVHDLYIVFNGSANYQYCADQCWAQVTPQCPAALKEGCGDGIGNFDWFLLAADCDPTAPYIHNDVCVASCPATAPLNHNGVCVATCPSGTYEDGTSCSTIPPGMKMCNGSAIPKDQCCPTARDLALLSTKACGAEKCDFTGGCFYGAKFDAVSMVGNSISFAGADLRNATFSATSMMSYGPLSFRGAKLDGAKFVTSKLSAGMGVDFDEASAADVLFSGTSVITGGGSLLSAKKASFDRLKMNGSYWSSTGALTVAGSSFKAANFSGGFLVGYSIDASANFDNAVFEKPTFTVANASAAPANFITSGIGASFCNTNASEETVRGYLTQPPTFPCIR